MIWLRRGKKKHQKNNFVYVFYVYVLEMIFERFFLTDFNDIWIKILWFLLMFLMIFKEKYDSFWFFYASVDFFNDFLTGFYDLFGKEKPTDRKFYFYFCFLMKQLCIGLKNVYDF